MRVIRTSPSSEHVGIKELLRQPAESERGPEADVKLRHANVAKVPVTDVRH